MLVVVLQWLAWVGAPIVAPGTTFGGFTAVIGGWVGGLAVVVWWAFFSRAPRLERWSAVVLMIVAMIATRPFLDESVATGNVGLQFFIYAVPVLSSSRSGAS